MDSNARSVRLRGRCTFFASLIVPNVLPSVPGEAKTTWRLSVKARPRRARPRCATRQSDTVGGSPDPLPSADVRSAPCPQVRTAREWCGAGETVAPTMLVFELHLGYTSKYSHSKEHQPRRAPLVPTPPYAPSTFLQAHPPLKHPNVVFAWAFPCQKTTLADPRLTTTPTQHEQRLASAPVS